MKDYGISKIIEETEKNPNPKFEQYVIARDGYTTGIFGVRSFDKNLGKSYGGTYFCQRQSYYTTIPGERVKRYGNTIYELIQRVVIKNKNHYKLLSKQRFGRLKKFQLEGLLNVGYEIIGCIWTGTGLIYAAKMNKDLEWELATFTD